MDIVPFLTCVSLFYLTFFLADRSFNRRSPHRQLDVPERPFRFYRQFPRPQREPQYNPRDAKALWETYFLLRRLLPPELIPSILEHAEYWLKVCSKRSDQVTAVEGRPRRYITTAPIHTRVFRPVRRVVVTIQSRDQGWSSYPQQWNTYENSWTWFDLQVCTMGPQGIIQPDESRTRKVVTNIHAGQQYHSHTVVWSDDDEDGAIRDLVRSVRNGEAISVLANAMFRGWLNNVGAVQIDLYLAAVR